MNKNKRERNGPFYRENELTSVKAGSETLRERERERDGDVSFCCSRETPYIYSGLPPCGPAMKKVRRLMRPAHERVREERDIRHATREERGKRRGKEERNMHV